MQNHEPKNSAAVNAQLNWIRAGVLGANDGIVSVAGLVVGVAGATTNIHTIFTAGLAGLVAGALSMAIGEYVSVSSQKDAEEALIEHERYELKHHPEQELAELAETYMSKGLSKKTATVVAKELTAHDPIKAHLDAELGMKEDELTNPYHAALASGVSFTLGALIPLLAILLTPASYRVPITFAAVIFALVLTGQVSARLSNADASKATIRVIVGGAIAMIATYGIGSIFGVNV